MKKVLHYYILLAATLYITIVAFSIFMISGWIGERYFNIMGENTLNLATVTANALSITNEQLKDLEEISFEELLQNESNQELSNIFKKTRLNQKVKYAYVVRKLDTDQITYQVTNLDKEFYEMPVGTELDWIWLMDVIVNEDELTAALKDKEYYADKNRYTHIDGETVELYNKRAGGYFINHDEWGDQISGMIPIYTIEGTYIGLLGVDVYSDSFYLYRNKVVLILFLLLLIPTVILFVIFMKFHLNYRKEMKDIVFQDKVTSLYTRTYYENYARQQLKNIRRTEDSISIIMMDIDDFKAYNDFYGHIMGDEALKKIGMSIRYEIELAGGCPGRYGGEEFVAFIPNIGLEKGNHLCQNLCKKIENLMIMHENKSEPKVVTISVGIYTSTKQDRPLELKTLIDKADKALYLAKKGGKNCFKREE